MPPTRFQAVGFGQCCWDRFGLVERFPTVDEKVETEDGLEQGGGPVATALACLSRLGVASSFLGSVGGDREGCLIRGSLLQAGVDCSLLQVDGDGSSQRAFIIVERASGLRTIFWHRGRRRPFRVSEACRELVRASRILLLDGLDLAAAIDLARCAKEAGVITLLDGGSVREGSADLLPLVDHLIVSARFARQFSGSDDPQTALEALAARGAAVVGLTRGEEGAWALEGGRIVHQPIFRVEVADTTGCGDVFHGAYAFGLLQDWDLSRRLRFAAACAAHAARQLGGRGGLPTLAEALQLENSGAI